MNAQTNVEIAFKSTFMESVKRIVDDLIFAIMNAKISVVKSAHLASWIAHRNAHILDVLRNVERFVTNVQNHARSDANITHAPNSALKSVIESPAKSLVISFWIVAIHALVSVVKHALKYVEKYNVKIMTLLRLRYCLEWKTIQMLDSLFWKIVGMPLKLMRWNSILRWDYLLMVQSSTSNALSVNLWLETVKGSRT